MCSSDLGDKCASSQCVGGAAPNCNDGNPCSDDSCDAGKGCVHAANAASCDDGNACTTGDKCAAGVCAGQAVTCQALDDCHVAGVCELTTGICTNPTRPEGSTCGGGLCTSAGVCVQCLVAGNCPGIDDTCQTRTCLNHSCGMAYALAGTFVANKVAGDCQTTRCDGAGSGVQTADGSDLPADDGNTCTAEVCSGGQPAHPPKPVGTPCNQSGGNACNGDGLCATQPQVVGVSPASGTNPAPSSVVSISFNKIGRAHV